MSLSWNWRCFCRLAVFRRPAQTPTAAVVLCTATAWSCGLPPAFATFFFPTLLGFSSLSSFVTRTARRHDIASFHLQPHPLIPLVGVACNSSVPRKKIDVHRLCRLGATFFPNFQRNRANKLESWMEPAGRWGKICTFQPERIFDISYKRLRQIYTFFFLSSRCKFVLSKCSSLNNFRWFRDNTP